MTIKELYEILKANIEGDPATENNEIMVGWKSLKGCRQRCLLEIDELYEHNGTYILLGEDRS